VAFRRVRAADVLVNPANYRRHPEEQREALRAVLREVGFAGALLVRRDRRGRLVLIDGQMRRDDNPDALLPTLVTDLTAREAELLLATYDPLGAMARRDEGQLRALLARVRTDEAALRVLLDRLASGSSATPAAAIPAGPSLADRFLVPPFTVLDARQGYWQERKRQWLALGIRSEIGRGGEAASAFKTAGDQPTRQLMRGRGGKRAAFHGPGRRDTISQEMAKRGGRRGADQPLVPS